MSMDAIKERLDRENVPRALRGAPIAFITAGLVSLVFVALDVALLTVFEQHLQADTQSEERFSL